MSTDYKPHIGPLEPVNVRGPNAPSGCSALWKLSPARLAALEAVATAAKPFGVAIEAGYCMVNERVGFDDMRALHVALARLAEAERA